MFIFQPFNNSGYSINYGKKIGEGQNEVFEAKYKSLDICVKKIPIKQDAPEEYNKNLNRELEIISKLKKIEHPNLIKYYDILSDERYIYIFMEKCQKTLTQYIQEKNYIFTQEEYQNFLYQMSCGYLRLIELQIIHRDLKPDNIVMMMNSNNKPIYKIIDFGVSKILGNANDVQGRFQTPAIIGTVKYISPEGNTGNYDHNRELYSLGIIICDMCDFQLLSSPNKRNSFFQDLNQKILTNIFPKKPEKLPSLIWLMLNSLIALESKRITWNLLNEACQQEDVGQSSAKSLHYIPQPKFNKFQKAEIQKQNFHPSDNSQVGRPPNFAKPLTLSITSTNDSHFSNLNSADQPQTPHPKLLLEQQQKQNCKSQQFTPRQQGQQSIQQNEQKPQDCSQQQKLLATILKQQPQLQQKVLNFEQGHLKQQQSKTCNTSFSQQQLQRQYQYFQNQNVINLVEQQQQHQLKEQQQFRQYENVSSQPIHQQPQHPIEQISQKHQKLNNVQIQKGSEFRKNSVAQPIGCQSERIQDKFIKQKSFSIMEGINQPQVLPTQPVQQQQKTLPIPKGQVGMKMEITQSKINTIISHQIKYDFMKSGRITLQEKKPIFAQQKINFPH